MVGATWGCPGESVVWNVPRAPQVGSQHDLVGTVVCADVSNAVVVNLFPCRSTIRVSGLTTELACGLQISVLKASFQGMIDDLPHFAAHECPVLVHPHHQTQDLWKVLEVCSGIGCSSHGFNYAGFRTIVGVDWNSKWEALFTQNHAQVDFVHGDVASDQTLIIELHAAGRDAGVLSGGFSCQPFSHGGQMSGALDSRAKCLFDILRAALILRKPVLVLECVSEASSNAWVRNILLGFSKQCHYQVSEIQLQMEKIWPCRRKRWWVALVTGELGRVPLVDYPAIPRPVSVRAVLPDPLDLTSDEIAELSLTPDEYRRILSFGQPSQMLLPMDEVCPTFVHSCGSQVLACPCGCRLPFTDETLRKRGIFGVLIPVSGATIELDGEIKPQFRHPHPWEVAILSGCPLPSQLAPGTLRLWLAGLGQMASPLHSVWVASQLRHHFEKLLGSADRCNPDQILCDYLKDFVDLKGNILDSRKVVDLVEGDLHFVSSGPVSGGNEFAPLGGEVPRQANSDLDFDVKMTDDGAETPWVPEVHVQHLGHDQSFSLLSPGGSPFVIPLSSPTATVMDLIRAEMAFETRGHGVRFWDVVKHRFLEHDEQVAMKVLLLCESDAVKGEVSSNMIDGDEPEVPPTAPFGIAMSLPSDPLAELGPVQLLSIDLPVVTSIPHLFTLMRQAISVEVRERILSNQGLLMADDENPFPFVSVDWIAELYSVGCA